MQASSNSLRIQEPKKQSEKFIEIQKTSSKS